MLKEFDCRKIDSLGRIVLPIELRRKLLVNENDAVSIFWDEERTAIMIGHQEPSCLCCAGQEGLKLLPNGGYLCAECLKSIQ